MPEVRLRAFPPACRDVLRAAARAADAERTYVVGGALRDLLLGRPMADLDLAVPRHAMSLAEQLARGGSRPVALDQERGTVRVLAPAPTGAVQVDVAEFRAPTIQGDLAGRDFTVDALAVSVSTLVRHGRAPLLDVVRGMTDLRKRRLRLAAPDAIDADPVRALRGLRLEAELGFALDAAAVGAIRAATARLAGVSGERLGAELGGMLKVPSSARVLRRADTLGVLARVVPEVDAMRGVSQPAPHRFDVLEHSFRAVEAADRLIASLDRLVPFGADLARHLGQPVGGGLTRRETLRLAALLHDVSKPETREVVDGRIRFFGHDLRGAERAHVLAGRCRLPGFAARIVETLVRQHLRLMHLGQAGTVTRRARHRFFRDLADEARDLLLLGIADAAALSGASPLTVWRRSALIRDLMAGWRDEAAATAAPPLVRGGDVMAEFGLMPGPEVGRLLARVREAQALGLVETRDDALAYLRSEGPDAAPAMLE